VRRSETRACCRALDLAWREDASNQDQRLLRNAVRLRVLPLLEELRPGSTRTRARTAELARSERDWLDPIVAAALDATLREPGPLRTRGLSAPDGPALVAGESSPDPPPGTVRLRATALAALPVALGRRVVRAACRRAGSGTPAAETTDAILALASQRCAGGLVRWPGGDATRDRDALVLAQPDDWPKALSNRTGSGAFGLPTAGRSLHKRA
jgi:hypothetical protein